MLPQSQDTEDDAAVILGGRITSPADRRTLQRHPGGNGFKGMKYARLRVSGRTSEDRHVCLCGRFRAPVKRLQKIEDVGTKGYLPKRATSVQ